jgi:hypothetical protein
MYVLPVCATCPVMQSLCLYITDAVTIYLSTRHHMHMISRHTDQQHQGAARNSCTHWLRWAVSNLSGNKLNGQRLPCSLRSNCARPGIDLYAACRHGKQPQELHTCSTPGSRSLPQYIQRSPSSSNSSRTKSCELSLCVMQHAAVAGQQQAALLSPPTQPSTHQLRWKRKGLSLVLSGNCAPTPSQQGQLAE